MAYPYNRRSLEKTIQANKRTFTKRMNESQNALVRQVIASRETRKKKCSRDVSRSKITSSEDHLVITKSQTSKQISGFEIDPKTQAVLDRKKYKIIEKLKQGSFGQVFRGEYVVDHKLVAIKVMDFTKLSQMFRVKYISRELKALIECRHRNVVQIYDIIRSNNRLFIFMEFCPNGDMASYIKTNGACSELLARYWFKQLVDALLHVHTELRMAHRDIKLDNVLLDEKFNAKLTDFGFAKDCWNETKQQAELAVTICGTEPYMCPQLIQRIQYNPYQADVWAMGVMLYGLLNGRFPFTWNDTNKMMIEQMNYPQYISSIFSIKLTHEAINLIIKMLDPEEKTRITLNQVAEHAWMKKSVDSSPMTLLLKSSKDR